MEELREKKLRQVRGLLDKAADPGTTPEEAQALRSKADELMLAYTISLWEAEQSRPEEVRQMPEWRYVPIVQANNPLKTQLIDLMGHVVLHCRCKALYTGLTVQSAGSQAHVVGFPQDIDYVEILFTSLNVQMARELEPHPDPMNSYIENLVMLKEAGLKWKRIHQLLHPEDPYEVTKAQGVKYTKLYTEYCTEHNRPRMRTSPLTYQRNYAEGFVSEVGTRMWQIRDQRKTTGNGMELAVIDQVKDEFNKQRAGKSVQLAGRSKFDYAAAKAGQAAGARADLGQTKVAKTKELN